MPFLKMVTYKIKTFFCLLTNEENLVTLIIPFKVRRITLRQFFKRFFLWMQRALQNSNIEGIHIYHESLSSYEKQYIINIDLRWSWNTKLTLHIRICTLHNTYPTFIYVPCISHICYMLKFYIVTGALNY